MKLRIVKPAQYTGTWSKRGRKVGEKVGDTIGGNLGKTIGGAVGQTVGSLLDRQPIGKKY